MAKRWSADYLSKFMGHFVVVVGNLPDIQGCTGIVVGVLPMERYPLMVELTQRDGKVVHFLTDPEEVELRKKQAVIKQTPVNLPPEVYDRDRDARYRQPLTVEDEAFLRWELEHFKWEA